MGTVNRVISDICKTCGGECCHKFSIRTAPGPKMRELLRAHYGRDVERVQFQVYHRCPHLTEGGLCDLWREDPAEDTRPALCQEYKCEKWADPGLLILPLTGIDLEP